MEKISKAERTRQFIIEKVAPIFNAKGFAGTSLSDLTEATGLTKGALYGHFKNKDELALEAFNYNLSLIQAVFAKTLAGEKCAIDQLQKLPVIYRQILPMIMAMGGCPMLNAISDTDDSECSTSLKTISIKALKDTKKRIEKILEKAVIEGSVKQSINPDHTAALILTLVEGGILMTKAMGKNAYFENATIEIEALINTIRV